jgi:hypothetical protein
MGSERYNIRTKKYAPPGEHLTLDY